MSAVISVENLSKIYHLGQIGTGTFANDLSLWYAKLRGKPNPLLKIGEKDHGNRDGEELWALKDVSFKVEQGEVLGIIGRNGAGKSTLLKILSRVTAPTSGKVKVKGRIASLLEVGTGFHPELTGRENIYLNGAILGMSKQEVTRKFDEIVDFSGVEKFIDTPVKRYSSGMYVRLAFAVAAHLEPEILIVDEVLAVGDISFQRKCFGKISDVAAGGRTVLIVSHDLRAIAGMADQTALLNIGKMINLGLTSSVISQYMKLNQEQGNHFEKNGFALSNIELLSNHQTNSNHGQSFLTTGELISLNFLVNFLAPCPKASIYIQLVDSLARVAYTSLTSDNPELDWRNFDAGAHRFNYQGMLHLAPGAYWINIGILNIHQRRKPLVQFDRVFSLEVLERNEKVFDGRSGPIYITGDWNIKRE